jgi:hypothetical protein
VQRLGVLVAHTQPCQPSPEGSPVERVERNKFSLYDIIFPP